MGRKGAIEPPSHAKDIFRHSNAPLLLKIRSIRIEEQKIDAEEYIRYLYARLYARTFLAAYRESSPPLGGIPTSSNGLSSQSLFVFRNLSFSNCRVVAGKNETARVSFL